MIRGLTTMAAVRVCALTVACIFFHPGTCRHCGAVLAPLTYRLRRHAETCFLRGQSQSSPLKKPLQQKKLAVPKADEAAVRRMIARAVFSMGVPFRAVENPHFVALLGRAFPGVLFSFLMLLHFMFLTGVTLPSRGALSSSLLDQVYEEERRTLRARVSRLPCKDHTMSRNRSATAFRPATAFHCLPLPATACHCLRTHLLQICT